MNENHKNGTISELIAQEYFINNGCTVSEPINSFGEYDMVVDYQNKLLRIQVKTIYRYKGEKRKEERYICNLEVYRRKSQGRHEPKRYTEKSFDFLCAVEPKTRAVYIVPIEDVLERSRGISFYPKSLFPGKHENERYNTKISNIDELMRRI